MTKRMMTAIVAMVVAGCDGAPTQDAIPAPVVTVDNPYHDRLLTLSVLQQGAALRTAIRSAGESCNRVEAQTFQQDYTNLKMWTARCQRTSYAVYLAPNGDVQVRNCDQAAALKLPACRTPATPADEKA